MIDGPKASDSGESNAKLLAQFAADSLLGAFTVLDPAAGRPVKNETGLRISDFRDEKGILTPDDA